MWRELEAVWERRQSELVTGAAVPQGGTPGGVSTFGSCSEDSPQGLHRKLC